MKETSRRVARAARPKRNGRGFGSKLMQLVMLLGVGTWFTHAQDRPDNIDELLTQFNLEIAKESRNNPNITDPIDDYGIKQYPKPKTQFDGVTSEMQVTYLQLNRQHGVEIPVLSTGTRNENTDFTVMLWFKIDAEYASKPTVMNEDETDEMAMDG